MFGMKKETIRPEIELTEEEKFAFDRRIEKIIKRHIADLKRNISENRLKIKRPSGELAFLSILLLFAESCSYLHKKTNAQRAHKSIERCQSRSTG